MVDVANFLVRHKSKRLSLVPLQLSLSQVCSFSYT
jgi:hypothetical protein